MKTLNAVFADLGRSPFRRRFRLGPKERGILIAKGTDIIAEHARKIVADRLAPARPANDGKQTPMRGHPVFIAQHATATCCRGCLAKWHGIPQGVALTDAAQQHAVAAILRWLSTQPPGDATPGASRTGKQMKLDL